MKRRAIVISLSKNGADHRLSLDDAVSHDGKVWTLAEHYTHRNLPTEAIKRAEFSEKELADFGHAVLARMHAFFIRGES